MTLFQVPAVSESFAHQGSKADIRAALAFKKPLTFPNYPITWSANCRGVAQTGRALGSGLRGRWFKSSHPDQFRQGRKLLNRASDAADDIVEKQS
jgi:hypothetical protein